MEYADIVTPLYPHVIVDITSCNGNACAMVARARMAARKAGLSYREIEEFSDEALSGSWCNVMTTITKWFDSE